jgi:hypothetical protein
MGEVMRVIALMALLAVTLLVCIPLIRGPGDSKASDALPSEVPMVLKVIQDGNRVAWSARSFFLEPVRFTRSWSADRKRFPSSLKALSWTFGLTAVVFVLYRKAFPKSVITQFMQLSEKGLPGQQSSPDADSAPPRLIDVTPIADTDFFLRHGVGVEGSVIRPAYALWPKFHFPKMAGAKTKQLMIGQAGCLWFMIQNALPESLDSKPAHVLFFLEFAFIATLCTYPVAWLFGTKISFGDTFAFISLIFAFYLVVTAISATVLPMLLVRFPASVQMQGPTACLIGCPIMLLLLSVNLAILGAIARAYFLGFKTFYGLGSFPTVCTLVAGVLLSPIIGTMLYLPTVLLLLRSAKLLKALW